MQFMPLSLSAVLGTATERMLGRSFLSRRCDPVPPADGLRTSAADRRRRETVPGEPTVHRDTIAFLRKVLETKITSNAYSLRLLTQRGWNDT